MLSKERIEEIRRNNESVGAFARAIEQEVKPKWLPIETAPKDGTRILIARIGKNEVGKDLGIWWVCRGFWSEKWNNWNDGVEPCGLYMPTHWMPLPEAPSNLEIEEPK